MEVPISPLTTVYSPAAVASGVGSVLARVLGGLPAAVLGGGNDGGIYAGGGDTNPPGVGGEGHIVRLGKATQQQAKDVLTEHRTSGASLGQLFVERGILAPKEWAEIYRQRQIIDTIGSAAGKASTGNSKMMAIVVAAVVVIAVVAYFVFLKK